MRVLTYALALGMIVGSVLTPITAYAKTITDYGEYGIVGGIMCHSTRVKYTYNNKKDVKKTIVKGPATQKGALENKDKKKKKTCTASYSLSTSTSTTISATLPQAFYSKILDEDIKLTVGKSKTTSETVNLSISEELPAKSSVKVYLRYDTETTIYDVTCQKQVQATNGKWEKSGSTYKKKITRTVKYPVLYTK